MRSSALLLPFVLWQCDAPPPPTHAVPPGPVGKPTTSTNVTTFAVVRFRLGDTAYGYSSNTAWKVFGYDIDGHITTKDSTDVCRAAVKTNQIDGYDGIDNAWGSSLLPIAEEGLAAFTPSDDVSSLIVEGVWTLLVQVSGLTDDPKQSATGLGAQIFIGASTSAPAFDSSTDWPVTPSSTNDGATIASGARVRFDTVYVTDGTIVARDATQPLTIPLVVLIHDVPPDGGVPKPPRPAALTLRISHPIVTLSTNGEFGVIAGVLAQADALAAAKQLSHQLNVSFCGSALDGIFLEVMQAVDILDDGTNNPGATCTAASLGIGFDAKRVANPTTVGQDPPPFLDPCVDAGAD